MAENKENKHGLNRWLKRIFSLEFVSVVIGLIGLYFAYDAFIKDKPGELCLFNDKQSFRKDIRYIFYGFEIKEDSITFRKAFNLPTLINKSSNEIKDVSVTAEMTTSVGFSVNGFYKYEIEKNQDSIANSMLFPYVYMTYATDRIGFGSGIPFPIYSLATDGDELFLKNIKMSYIYQGMSEDVINLTYYIVGIPEGYRDEDGKVIDAEYAFIKAIRPYLLYQ